MRNIELVTVFLNNLQFEAEKFETRTMPTPNMKGKEMIYWIKVGTEDKRLATELQRFLQGAPKFIDLRVPSVFVAVKTELEDLRVFPPKDSSLVKDSITQQKDDTKSSSSLNKGSSKEGLANETREGGLIRIEILLRRTLPETPEKQTRSPYG